MTAELVQKYAPLAEEALNAFLSTLLDDDATLDLDAPSETDGPALQDELDAGLVVGVDEVFVVALDRSWVQLVSESMLGRRVDIDDEGVDDLFREIASQGYGTLRNQLSARDIKLPDLSIEPFLPGTAAPSLAGAAWRVPFQLTYDGASYGGYALLLQPPDDAPAAAEPPAQAASETADQEAPGSGLKDEDMPDPTPAGQGGASVASANFSELGEEKIHGPRADTKNFELLSEVELEVSVELGRRRLPLSDVLQLTSGSVIELEKLVGEPLSLYANGRFVAEGEAVVIDEKFGIRITNLAPKKKRSEALM